MEFLFIGIAAVVVLLGVAAWMDLTARRSGRRILGVDGQAALDARRDAQAESEQRIRYQNYDGGLF
jgi:hypothetical protein